VIWYRSCWLWPTTAFVAMQASLITPRWSLSTERIYLRWVLEVCKSAGSLPSMMVLRTSTTSCASDKPQSHPRGPRAPTTRPSMASLSRVFLVLQIGTDSLSRWLPINWYLLCVNSTINNFLPVNLFCRTLCSFLCLHRSIKRHETAFCEEKWNRGVWN